MSPHAHMRRVDGGWVMDPAAVGDFAQRVAMDGHIQVVWSCALCDYVTGAVAHQALGDIDIKSLDVIADYSGVYARCSVRGCDAWDVQLHHFAPRALFGDDCDLWPVGYLCRAHHAQYAQWHQRVTSRVAA